MFLFDSILYVPSTIFQLNRDGSSWVETVLSQDKCDHNAVMPVRLEPAAPRSRVKHSTTEPLRSQFKHVFWVLKRTASMRLSVEFTKDMFWLPNKKKSFKHTFFTFTALCHSFSLWFVIPIFLDTDPS